MATKLWSQLSSKTQARYKKDGVSPQRYNAYTKMSFSQKKHLEKNGLSRDKYLKTGNVKEARKKVEQTYKQKHKSPDIRTALKNAEYYISELNKRKLSKEINEAAIRQHAMDFPDSYSKERYIDIALQARDTKDYSLADEMLNEFVWPEDFPEDMSPYFYH